ncbi:MAG: hypothetical protein HY556_07190 [Euryarchaeota archaeon]|nr:hypothetical protein [Euryarchaeota archaeon]
MNDEIPPDAGEVHEVTPEESEDTRRRILAAKGKPLHRTGTVTECPMCGGRMLTTNNLSHTIPTPRGLLTLTRLSGAECLDCDEKEYDMAAIAVMTEHENDEIVADYETRVTTTGGKTLGTYFKEDLRRVLGLKGKEKLSWKVMDADHAYVTVDRAARRK